MNKYRFKTYEEFASDQLLAEGTEEYVPRGWDGDGEMTVFYGEELDSKYDPLINLLSPDEGFDGPDNWTFWMRDLVLIDSIPDEEITALQE